MSRQLSASPAIINITLALDPHGRWQCLGVATLDGEAVAAAARADASGEPPPPRPPAVAAEPSLYLTVRDACGALRISAPTFWRRKAAFDIRKFGSRTLITRASVERVAADMPKLPDRTTKQSSAR